MQLPLTGRCQCQSVRYAINAGSLTLYACHCTDCQKQTGSAFALSMVVARGALAVVAGEPRDKLAAVRRFIADGSMRPVSILCGNGGLFLPQELERGAAGAMTGYAFPEMLVELVRLIRSGDRVPAHDLFDAHLPLLRYEQQPGAGLAVRKYVLKRRGVITSDAQRAPASKLSAESIAEIEWMLDRLVAKGGPSLDWCAEVRPAERLRA